MKPACILSIIAGRFPSVKSDGWEVFTKKTEEGAEPGALAPCGPPPPGFVEPGLRLRLGLGLGLVKSSPALEPGDPFGSAHLPRRLGKGWP